MPSLKAELHEAWSNLANLQQQLELSSDAQHSFDAARDVLENIPRETSEELFELAVVYGALATPLEGSAEVSDEDKVNEHRRYADLAMETLQKAIEAGFDDIGTLEASEHLAVLRERDDYQELIGPRSIAYQAERLANSNLISNEQRIAARDRAADFVRELAGSDAPDHQQTLAAVLHSMGIIQAGLKQYDEAEESLRKELEIRLKLLATVEDPAQA